MTKKYYPELEGMVERRWRYFIGDRYIHLIVPDIDEKETNAPRFQQEQIIANLVDFDFTDSAAWIVGYGDKFDMDKASASLADRIITVLLETHPDSEKDRYNWDEFLIQAHGLGVKLAVLTIVEIAHRAPDLLNRIKLVAVDPVLFVEQKIPIAENSIFGRFFGLKPKIFNFRKGEKSALELPIISWGRACVASLILVFSKKDDFNDRIIESFAETFDNFEIKYI